MYRIGVKKFLNQHYEKFRVRRGGGGNRIGLCSDSFTLSKIGLRGGEGRDEATKVAIARF